MKKNRFSSGIRGIGLLCLLLALAGCASKSPAPVVERGGPRSATPLAAVPAPATGGTYTVKSGDTLYSIAREHGMDFRELIAMNNIENPNQISVGRVLKVRSPAAGSDVAVATPVTADVVVARPIDQGQVTEKRPAESNTETLKREPKAGKEPYSDQVLALAQNQGQAKPVAENSAVVAAKREVKPESRSEEKPADKPVESALGGDEIPWIWPTDGKVVAGFSENDSKGIDISGKAGDAVIAAGDGKVVYSGTGLRGYGKLVIIKHNNTYLSAYAHNQNILVKEGQAVAKGQKIAEMGNTDADQVKLHFEVRRQGKPVDPLKYLPAR